MKYKLKHTFKIGRSLKHEILEFERIEDAMKHAKKIKTIDNFVKIYELGRLIHNEPGIEFPSYA